jgi:GrpB-like predicted nucleotidyltransferase (UPF0157 family)
MVGQGRVEIGRVEIGEVFIMGRVMFTIVSYQLSWHLEFEAMGSTVREALADRALRIDHIGSTSVPGLAAKDIIDIQVTVAKLEAPVEDALHCAGYRRLEHIDRDHIPPGTSEKEEDWRKWFFKGASDQRPVNLHVRVVGRANQRYPLLFRDYLRTHDDVAQAYAQIKTALSRYHANDEDAYYAVKDPVCDLIMGGAEAWATLSGWAPGSSDC